MHAATEGLNQEGQGRKRRKESNRNVGKSRQRRKKSWKTVKLDCETKNVTCRAVGSAAFVQHCTVCAPGNFDVVPIPPIHPRGCEGMLCVGAREGKWSPGQFGGPKSLLFFFVYVLRCERPRREYYEGESSPAAAVFYHPPTPNRTQHHKPPPPFPPPLLSPM